MDYEANGPVAHDTLKASEYLQRDDAVCFGAFVLLPREHLLFRHAEPVPLGSRAMSLLVALAARPGQLLEKAELLSLAWPKAVVEECNLRAQIVALRRALSDDQGFEYIVTVPGRGYRFNAPVRAQSPAPAPVCVAVEKASELTSSAPPLKRQVVGREKLIQQLAELTTSRRLLTLSGPGGVGKTTVALAVAESLAPRFAQTYGFVDLAPVSSAQPVQGLIACALGLGAETDHPLRNLPASLIDRPHLLVLDNCEHLLDETAAAVETLLLNAPLCCVVITSREPLRAENEWVHELAPLRVPHEHLRLSATQAMTFSSVALFVARIKDQDPDFQLDDHDTEAVAAICRKLDGNPLAIELAAARVRTFGLRELVGLLDGSFRLQMTGRRTALPRQRSLSAALDWTYGMLSNDEQALLRQLSVFNGSFTLDGVLAIVDIGLPDVRMTLPMIESLLDKSLLATVEHDQGKRYRLLETTRLYAREKLFELDDSERLQRAHADWALHLLDGARQALEQLTHDAWTRRYGVEIDTVRAALEWAYCAPDGRQLGIELTLLSSPLWLRLSLVGEYHEWVNRGLPRHAEVEYMDRRQRMRLLTVSGSILMLTYGAGQKMREVWQQVGDDADALDDSEHRLRSLWGLWNDLCCNNLHPQARQVAERFLALGKDPRVADCLLLGKRMRATSAFYMGDMQGASQAINEALGAPLSLASHIVDMHFDQRIAAQSLKAQVQLLEGHIGQAMVTLDSNLQQAVALSHPATLWYTLAISAIPATLIAGTLHKTRHYLDQLKDSTARQPLPIWRDLTLCYESVLAVREGDTTTGVPQLGEALNQLRSSAETPLHSMLHVEYALGLAAMGLEPLALETLNHLHETALERQDRWYLPELMRVKAQVMHNQPHAHTLEEVRKLLSQALEIAREDGTHFWAWRINTDLNHLKTAPATSTARAWSSMH
jgi:predicted ATPase/DNA-binding winged helix-turn-helix (wHTH) protein